MQKMGKDETLGAAMVTALAMLAAAFLLPTLCFGGAGGATAEGTSVLPPTPTAVQAEEPEPGEEPDVAEPEIDSGKVVRVLEEDGTVTEMDLAQYLWGVVAAEMPASFEMEALKAQAVAARTYTLWKSIHNGNHAQADICKDYTCCQAWISKEEAMENWGELGEVYALRIAAAVAGTDGMVLCWEGEPIQAVFHSSSDGRTEDAVAVWGSTVPYLVGVDTPEGAEVPNYHSQVSFTAQEMAEVLKGLGGVLEDDPSVWFQNMVCTDNGAVASVEVGGATLSGSTLRTALGLRSASFGVSYDEGVFTFSVIGYGHGVGMSQYGANALAAQGKDWREIVTWYYSGVSVETLRMEETVVN